MSKESPFQTSSVLLVPDAPTALGRAVQLGAGMWEAMRRARLNGGDYPTGVMRADVVEGRGPCTCAARHLWLSISVDGNNGCYHMLSPFPSAVVADLDSTQAELVRACALAALFSVMGSWGVAGGRPGSEAQRAAAIPFVDASASYFPGVVPTGSN